MDFAQLRSFFSIPVVRSEGSRVMWGLHTSGKGEKIGLLVSPSQRLPRLFHLHELVWGDRIIGESQLIMRSTYKKQNYKKVRIYFQRLGSLDKVVKGFFLKVTPWQLIMDIK